VSADDLVIPEEQRGRQAVASLGGYAHQLIATAAAWVDLGPGESLLVEVAEDYAILAEGALRMVQQKRETGSALTLRRADAQAAIRSLWQFRVANPGHDVRLHLLTTAPVGRERGFAFPGEATGVDWWRRAARGDDVEPLRDFLRTLDWPADLAGFLASASAESLRADMLGRISWLADADPTDTLLANLTERLRGRAVSEGLLASDGERALPILLMRVLETLFAKDRRLTSTDFQAAWEKATTIPVSLGVARQMMGQAAAGAAPGADQWQPVTFDQPRGLGPALLGRALGAADAIECPRLPEAAELVKELDASYSARLAGMPGAGKSVCALQAARIFADKGYRVVRLTDLRSPTIQLCDDGVPTLHLIDDAHLASSPALALAEQSSRRDRLLLSTFTTVDVGATSHGTIHLDAKRAVRVIADDLRSRRAETLAAVRKVDDRVGEMPGKEDIDLRIDTAATSEFPWQFCFVLSGGWRRVRSIVASARAAKADMVLGAIAIRQLASRDARAAREDLDPLLGAGGIDARTADKAIAWLVQQRLVIAADDLRCPHQRFSARVFDPILVDQDKAGREQLVAMLGHAFADPAMPLSGLGTLLIEFRMSGSDYRWYWLVGRELLEPFIARCWSATSAADIAAAMHALREVEVYIKDYLRRPTKDQIATIARLFSAPLPGAAYAIGSFINGTYRNRRFGRAIIRGSDPEALANILNRALEPATADFASEIAKMISQSFGALTPEWTARFLARLDRQRAMALASRWPNASSLYRAAWFVASFTYLEREFGLDLTGALAPAIAERLRADPVEAFDELEDVFWNSLRVLDPLGLNKGKYAPTARSLNISGQICSAWDPPTLAGQLSQVGHRQFQRAAGLLDVLRKSLPEAYQQVVAAIDWSAIEATIGEDWKAPPHEAIGFLCQAYDSRPGRKAVAQLIEKHVDEIESMGSRFAFIAPKAAYRQIERGGKIMLANRWDLGAAVLADFHKHRRSLVPALLADHTRIMADALSKKSLNFTYDNALMFLRVCRQVAPESFEAILDQIDIPTAEVGWREALTTAKGKRRAPEPTTRVTVAWLIQVARDRQGALGDLARQLLTELPRETKISPKKLEFYKDL